MHAGGGTRPHACALRIRQATSGPSAAHQQQARQSSRELARGSSRPLEARRAALERTCGGERSPRLSMIWWPMGACWGVPACRLLAAAPAGTRGRTWGHKRVWRGAWSRVRESAPGLPQRRGPPRRSTLPQRQCAVGATAGGGEGSSGGRCGPGRGTCGCPMCSHGPPSDQTGSARPPSTGTRCARTPRWAGWRRQPNPSSGWPLALRTGSSPCRGRVAPLPTLSGL